MVHSGRLSGFGKFQRFSPNVRPKDITKIIIRGEGCQLLRFRQGRLPLRVARPAALPRRMKTMPQIPCKKIAEGLSS
jgi:hypothetical protein